MKPNRSVLQYPECENPLVNIGSKVARFIRDRYIPTVVIWFLLMPGVILLTYKLSENRNSGSLGTGHGLFALALVLFVVNFLLLRLFPVWRITDCPYCGFHEKQKLGLSESGEL